MSRPFSPEKWLSKDTAVRALCTPKTSRPRSVVTATTLCSAGCALPRLWKLLDQAFGAPLDDNAKRCVWHAANSLAAAGDVHFTQYVPLHCASTKHATPVARQAATGDASVLRV
jgi:hypothetical protein